MQLMQDLEDAVIIGLDRPCIKEKNRNKGEDEGICV